MKRRVLILGASSDIGVEVIKKILEKKWQITAHYSNNKKILTNFSNLNLIRCDFSKINENNCKKIIDKLFNDKYEILINLVGYIDNKSYQKSDLKSLIKSIKINTLIPMLIQRKIINNMEKKRFGRILNASSIGVKFGGGNNTFNYGLSKHCLEFIPNNHKEWAKNNICINNLRIGVTNTKIHKKIKKKLTMKKRINLIPAARMASPAEIANYILELISEKNTYMTGQTITVAGGE
jgi:NAD(P)-dependent dehydrogenase (short-subunit alcohol dehydrogenase family)